MKETTYNQFALINSDSTSLSAAVSTVNLTSEISDEMNSSTLQPLDTTFVAIFLLTLGALCIVAMYLHYLVLIMAKRDSSIVTCLLPDFALNFLVGGPAAYILFSIVTLLSDPAAEVIGIWFCHVGSIIMHVWMYKVLVFSLLVALLRYLYVVHNEKIMGYGLPRVERIFRILYWAVPIGLTTLHFGLRNDYVFMAAINRCYGWSLSGWYKTGRHFCFVMDHGFPNRFAEYGFRSLCMFNVVVRMLLFSNIAEAVIYYRIHVHLKR